MTISDANRSNGANLFGVARVLAGVIPLQLAVKSKSERGYELLDGEQDAPVKAVPVDLFAAASTREAFQIIARACLKQVVCNELALIKGDPEGVHQMRVGRRRLRGVAISLFSGLLRDAQTSAVKTELKWLTGELGPARELEGLVKRWSRRCKGDMRIGRDCRPCRTTCRKTRERTGARASAAKSARFRALTLEVAAWLEASQWTNPRDDLVRDRGDLPVAVSAADELTRRWRKVRKNVHIHSGGQGVVGIINPPGDREGVVSNDTRPHASGRHVPQSWLFKLPSR